MEARMKRTLIAAAAALALCTALFAARAQDNSGDNKPAEVVPPVDAPPADAPPAAQPPAEVTPPADASPPKHSRRRVPFMRGGMAMKQVVCKPIDEGKGKAGLELAAAIEALASQLQRANYRLTALLPGDPPIACFQSLSDPSQLPRGAR
jgi:hypothetical protein